MRGIMILAASMLATTAFSDNGYAAAEHVRLCTGEVGQAYEQAGKAIKSMNKGSRVMIIDLVENTGGTTNNIDRATQGKRDDAGACDAFIGQPNGLNELAERDRSVLASIQQVGSANNEYAQIVCSKTSGIKNVSDLISKAKSTTIALGPSGSGAWLMWKSFVKAEPALANVGVTAEDKALALVAVANNNTTCAAFPEGLRGRWMNTGNAEYAGQVTLVEIAHKPFGKIKDFRGNPMYTDAKIPAGTYPGLQPKGGFFSSPDVKTVMWKSGVYVNTDRVTDSRILSELVTTVTRAMPIINRTLNADQ